MKNQFPAISRQNRLKAIEEGKTTYESGTECKNCGTFEKYVKNSSCVACVKTKTYNRDPSISKKYIKSEKGRKWLNDYRKTEVYRDVQNRYVRKDYQKNKDWYVERNLKHNYNLSLDDYKELIESQNNQCYICLKPPKNKMLCVDHNHETGLVRKLLCHGCNTALGLVNENPEVLKNMIKYIEEHNIV